MTPSIQIYNLTKKKKAHMWNKLKLNVNEGQESTGIKDVKNCIGYKF